MNKKITTIQKKEDFKAACNLIENSYAVNQKFPNQVFVQRFHSFLFEEFDWTMTPEFWTKAIQPLMAISQDTHLLVAVLDPDPTSYFYREFSHYNLIKFPIDISGDDYWKSLETGPKNSPADAILFNSEIVVWLPLSTKWAVWGSRSYGIGVLAFADDAVKASASTITKEWKSAELALNKFIAINFKDKKIPKDFFDSFASNYAKNKEMK